MVGNFAKSASVAALLALEMIATPASADVKKGVDAWTGGDYAAAVREWADPAARGDPDAQFNMAQAYRLGRGVDIDLVQAEALYAKAAAQGHVKAADNYGLLLFQRGERGSAMPYIQSAAERGDPRAQYLLGIAHFNGDIVVEDWRRAYALLTLANSVGLPQAREAMAQMDEYIPLEDRQAAQTLAAALKTEAEAARARDLAAVDLALGNDASSGPVVTAPSAPTPPTRAQETAISSVAGADYTLPKPVRSAEPVVIARAEPSREEAVPAPKAAAPATQAKRAEHPTQKAGPWKVQLGAFSVPGNADKLWGQLASRGEIAGREKVKVSSGKLTMLFAGGYASRSEAQAACTSLKSSGRDCLVTR